MADIIGQETWTADGVDYVVKLTEPGATVTENAISIISPVRLRRGDPNYEPLEPVLESQIGFQVRDTSKLLRTALAGKQAGDIVLEFTADAAVIFKGYVVPDYQRHLAYLSSPEFSLSAYDGIEGLKGFTYAQGGYSTLREALYHITNKIGLSLTLNIYFDWKEDNADASTEHPDALRLRLENLMEREGTYYDALLIFCDFFNAQLFQRAGEWHFMQRSLRESSMTEYPTDSAGSSGTANTVDYLVTVSSDDLHREQTYFWEQPAVARVVSRHKFLDYALRNGDFSEGVRYWDSGNTTEHADGRLLDNTAEYLEQEIGKTFQITPVTNRDRVNLTYSFTVAIDAAATGSGDVEWGYFKFIDLAGNERWLDTTGGWNSSETSLKSNVANLALVAGTDVDFSSSFTSADFPFEPMGGTLKLIFEPIINSNPWITSIIHSEYQVRHLTPDEDEDIIRPTERVYTLESTDPGTSVEHEFLFGDADSGHIAPGVIEIYDGTDWIKAQDWDGSGQLIHELRATDRHDQVKERLKSHEFAHTFGADIDIHNSIVYDHDGDQFGEVYPLVFVEKVYPRSGKVITKSVGHEIIGSNVFAGVATTLYFMNGDDEIKRAPIDRSTTGWTSTLIRTETADSVIDFAVDQAAGKMFTVIANTGDNNRYIKVSDLLGTAPSTLLTFTPANASFAPNVRICLDRPNQRIFCAITDYTSSDRTAVYSYAGVLIKSASFIRDTTSIGACAVAEDGSYMVYQTHGGGNKRVQKYDYAGNANTDIETSAASVELAAHAFIDDAYGKVFWEWAGEDKIRTWPTPAGGSFTAIITTAGSNEYGLAGDRVYQKLYVGTTNNTIKEYNYDGTGERTVIDESVGGTDIKHICLGV